MKPNENANFAKVLVATDNTAGCTPSPTRGSRSHNWHAWSSSTPFPPSTLSNTDSYVSQWARGTGAHVPSPGMPRQLHLNKKYNSMKIYFAKTILCRSNFKATMYVITTKLSVDLTNFFKANYYYKGWFQINLPYSGKLLLNL